MGEGYPAIIKEHLRAAWARGQEELAAALPAAPGEGSLGFEAFGRNCEVSPEGVTLGGENVTGPRGVLIALYALNVKDRPVELEPLVSFKELPGSMPYQAAFTARAEAALAPHVTAIRDRQEEITSRFSGHMNEDAPSGDFSFTLYPLPRAPLFYIFFLPDEEFPASATCLFPEGATKNLPVDGLADLAEHTARGIISLLE